MPQSHSCALFVSLLLLACVERTVQLSTLEGVFRRSNNTVYTLQTDDGSNTTLRFLSRPQNLSTGDRVQVNGTNLSQSGFRVQSYKLVCQLSSQVTVRGSLRVTRAMELTLYDLLTGNANGYSDLTQLSFAAAATPSGLSSGDKLIVTGCKVDLQPLYVWRFIRVCRAGARLTALQGELSVMVVDDFDRLVSTTICTLRTANASFTLDVSYAGDVPRLRTGARMVVKGGCWDGGSTFPAWSIKPACPTDEPLDKLQGTLSIMNTTDQVVYSLLLDDGGRADLDFSQVGDPTWLRNGDRLLVTGRCYEQSTPLLLESCTRLCRASVRTIRLKGTVSVTNVVYLDTGSGTVELGFANGAKPNDIMSGDMLDVRAKCYATGQKAPVVSYAKVPVAV